MKDAEASPNLCPVQASMAAEHLCYEQGVMDEQEEKTIIERLRARLRETDARSPPRPGRRTPVTSDPSGESMAIDAEILRDSVDVYDQPFRSQRPLAPALALVNRTVRKLLRPSLERQVSYNAANERLVRALRDEVESLKRAQRELRQRCDTLETLVASLQGASQGG
jgi:hypothetical protein